MANRALTRKKWYKGGGPGLIAAVKANDVNLVKQKLTTTIFGRYFGRSDVNSIDKETGKSALIIAAENDFREIFKILLDHKADINIMDLTKKYVFHYLNSETATILCEFLVKNKQGISIKAFTNFDDSLIPFFTVAFRRLSYSIDKDYLAKLVSRTGSLDAKKTMFNLFIQNPPIPTNIKLFIETDTSLYFLHQIINNIGLMDNEVKGAVLAVLKYLSDHKLVDEVRQLLSEGNFFVGYISMENKILIWRICVTNNFIDIIRRLLFEGHIDLVEGGEYIKYAFEKNYLETENVVFNHMLLKNLIFSEDRLIQVLKLNMSITPDDSYLIAIKERVNKLLSARRGNGYYLLTRYTDDRYRATCTILFQACLKYNFTDELKMMLNATHIHPDPIYFIVNGELNNFNIDDEKVDIFVDFISHAVKRVSVNDIVRALNVLFSLRNHYYFDTIIRKLNDKNSLRDFKVVDLVTVAVHNIGNNGTNFDTLLLLLNNGFSYDKPLYEDEVCRNIIKHNSRLQSVMFEYILSKVSDTYRTGFPKIFIEKEKTSEIVKIVYIEKVLQSFQEMYPRLRTGNIKKDRLLDEMHRLTILMLGVDTWQKSDEPSKLPYFDIIGKFIFELIKVVNPIEGEKMDLTIEDIYIFYFSIGFYADDFHTHILDEKTFFVDYYEKGQGFNYLIYVINATHVHSDIRLPIIRALITKQININAVDKDGNTVLHHALNLNKIGLCSDNIVEILINHPLICPNIKNNTGQSAIDITNRKWVEKIEGQKTGQIYAATIKWKGLTRKWINQLIDFYFDSKTGLFYNPANQVYCLSCLGQGARPSACDHVTGHNCSDSYRSKLSDYARRGGIPPGFNRDLLRNRGDSECCARCNEKTAATHCRYGCGGDYQCNCLTHFGADAYKYYKLYKMIERFATYQDAQLDRLFIDVWLDVTNFGASVPFNRQACVDFRQNVQRTKTFIPAAILDRFPNVEETDIYPSGFKATPIPNMRRTDDVINNNLMPSIIDYGAEEMNNIDFESYSRFINFRHRKNIKPDFPINEHRDRGVGFVCTTVKENTRIKCLNADEIRPEKLCDSYLFPDELGILVSSGDLDHESYILYRDKFMYSEILDFDSAAYPYFIGQSIKKPNIMPVQSACEGGSSSHAGGTRRSRRKVKSVRRTKRS